MRLRLRLLVTTLLVAAPLMVALSWLSANSVRAGLEHLAVEYVLTQMLSGERERCEAAPASWELRFRPGPPTPAGAPRVFAYGPELRPANPAAPSLSAALLAARQAQPEASSWSEPGDGLTLLMRMPWGTGPCAYVLTRSPLPRRLLPPPQIWLPPLVAICLALMFSVGSVVGRVRALTREVEASTREGYLRDVTPQGRDEISDLARAFVRASGEIRGHLEHQAKREKALREFLANTTHDVMIPLTVLQGHLARFEALAQRQAPAAEGEVRAAVGEALYMSSLLHNLSLAARLETGEPAPQREPVELNAMIDRVVGRYAPLAQQSGVALNAGAPPEPVRVQGDSTMLEQALSNLVYNSVRYNHPGGHVGVALEREGGAFVLRVVDDGPGVPPDQLARLAERGFRTDAARSRAPGGQGLGLSIAREVADRHGLALRMSRPAEGGLCAELCGACLG